MKKFVKGILRTLLMLVIFMIVWFCVTIVTEIYMYDSLIANIILKKNLLGLPNHLILTLIITLIIRFIIKSFLWDRSKK